MASSQDITKLELSTEIVKIKQIIVDTTYCPDDFCETKSRCRTVVEARSIFAYVLFKLHPKLTGANIGWLTGKRDHASALHSRMAIQNLIDTDKEKKQLVDNILALCRPIMLPSKIDMFGMAQRVIDDFLQKGKYDGLSRKDDTLHYMVNIEGYVWNNDDVVSRVLTYYNAKGINCKYYKNFLLFNQNNFQ